MSNLEFEDNNVGTDAEMMAYQEALDLNRKLKEMMLLDQQKQQEQQREWAPPAASTKQSQQQQQRRRKVEPSSAAIPARNRSRNNYTFNDSQINDMRYGNQHLVSRLQRIATRDGSSSSWSAQQSNGQKRSSSKINRLKKDEEVARQNKAFAKRLERVKPSISRVKMEKDHVKNRQIANNIRSVKPRAIRQMPEWQ